MSEEDFRAFYERTARPLWSYLSRISGNRQQADDLLQEAYYRFYRAGRQYENESHRRNSLFQIATNLVRDGARALELGPRPRALAFAFVTHREVQERAACGLQSMTLFEHGAGARNLAGVEQGLGLAKQRRRKRLLLRSAVCGGHPCRER